jgi:hypothetical protein
MKLCLNILLIAALFFHISTCKRTEERTVEEDGTIDTVITDEWQEVEERHFDGRGHGRGRGDTIVVMTNDNENDDHKDETEVAATGPTSIKDKTVILNRLYSAQLSDYHYSVDPQEQTTLNNAGYKPDGSLGLIVTKREHFPDCPDLVPITRLGHDGYTAHALVVTSANVHLWMTSWGWKNPEVIGYGVLEKGKCGATLAVRHLGGAPGYTSYQTSSDAERSTLMTLGFADHVAPIFYVWDSTENFIAPKLPHAHKTAVLTRLYKEQGTDFHYVNSEEAQATLGRLSYQFDGTMGRVVTKQTDMPECTDLVPITLLSHGTYTGHGLVVNAANVKQWINDWGWKDGGVIGYGVLTKGKCGANVAVRHLMNPVTNFIHISNDAEYNLYKADLVKYGDHVAPVFYIWEA